MYHSDVCEEGLHVNFILIFKPVQQKKMCKSYTLIQKPHAHTSLLLDGPFLSLSPFHLTHLLQLLVPHCSLLSLPPSNILLTHNCGTHSPVLPINPNHRHLGPLSRLSVNVHSKVSKSGPFLQRVPGRFSQATSPTAEHAFHFTDCTDRNTSRTLSL